jgi:hypothetical protein
MRNALPFIAAMALFGTGCVPLTVGPGSPRPNVIVAAEKLPASLVLDPAILDDFVIPSTGSGSEVTVRSWRTTLTAGYQSAFPTPGTSGRQLVLLKAELSFAPAAVSGGGRGGTAAVIAAVRYQAKLLDSSGNELGAIAGNAQAREPNINLREPGMTDNASKAVDALYEALVVDLLSKN